MSTRETIDLMHAYVKAINEGTPEQLEPLLAPEVAYFAPPHAVRFPGNVVARLRAERYTFPEQRLEVETAFAGEDGARGAMVVCWTVRRLTSRVCIAIEARDGKITRIESFGGLMKTMFDVGLARVA